MAVQKPQGSQIDIQSVANDIANDSTAIGDIATGVTSDPGAQATMDADYLRVDGANEAGVALFSNDANYQGQVVPGVAGDFAALDASGNIIDSALNAADFATAAQGLLADSALQDITAENIQDLQNVSSPPTPPADQVFRANGSGGWLAGPVVKAIITDFSDGDYATAAQGLLADSALQDITAESVADLSDVPDYTGAGNQYVRVNNGETGLEYVDEVAVADGAVGTPSIGFLSDNDTGLYSPGADSIAIAVGGAKALEIETDGTLNVNGTTDYETLVTSDDDIPNKKWIDDQAFLTAELNDLTAAVVWDNIPDANVPQSAVTQHEAALTITESQISDLAHFGGAVDDLSDVANAAPADRHVLVYDGVTDNRYENRLLVEADFSDLQAYLTAEANDLTAAVVWDNIPDANVPQSAVTQHEAALTVTEAQISDLGTYVAEVTGVSGNVVEFGAGNAIADSGVALSSKADVASPTFTGVPTLPTYTLGTLPAVGTGGGMIYVSDATGSGVTGSMCFSNGTSWIDVTTGIAVA